MSGGASGQAEDQSGTCCQNFASNSVCYQKTATLVIMEISWIRHVCCKRYRTSETCYLCLHSGGACSS